MKIFKLFAIMILVVGLSINIAKADFIFGEPTKTPNINTSSFDGCGSITSDGLELYFASYHPHGGDGCYGDIYVATRPTIHDAWSEPIKLGPPINTSYPEGASCISADGLELYFTDGWGPFLFLGGCSRKPGGYGGTDIWVSTRETRSHPWGEPQNLGPDIISDRDETEPSISQDGLSLYFTSDGEQGNEFYDIYDIYVAQRLTKHDPWDPPENLGPPVNTDRTEHSPFISPDNLSLFFSRSSANGLTSDIYVSRRISTTDPWGIPVPLESVNSMLREDTLIFAPGDSTLYFNRSDNLTAMHDINTFPAIWTTTDIWQVEVTPIVDFNSDGIVDVLDVTIMVDNWHTDNTLCDIAPAPLGDGFVDIQDLTVLAEHLFEEVPAP